MNIYRRIMDTNLLGSFYCTKYAAWHLKDKPEIDDERGLIINVTSIGDKCGPVGEGAYAASKGALEGMLLPVARELGQYNIRVMNISAGAF